MIMAVLLLVQKQLQLLLRREEEPRQAPEQFAAADVEGERLAPVRVLHQPGWINRFLHVWSSRH